MVDLETSPRIIIQNDWDQILREKDGSAWVTFRKLGEESVHGHLKTQAVSDSGEPYITSSPHTFAVPQISRKTITVSYGIADAPEKTVQFQAPRQSFATVHGVKNSVTALDVTPGGLAVSCDTKGRLLVWTSDNGEVRRDLAGHCGVVNTCQFFPSGVVILSGGADTQIKIWAAETGKCAATLTGHQAGVSSTAVVDKGRNVVSGSRDGCVRLWDVGQQSCIHTWEEIGVGVVNQVALSPVCSSVDLGMRQGDVSDREVLTDGKLLLVAGELGSLVGFGLHTREKVLTCECGDAVNCCAFLSETLTLCGTQDGKLYFHDLRNTSSPVRVVGAHGRSAVLSLCPWDQGCFVSTGDGSCFYVDDAGQTGVELTGPDCDPVYCVSHDGGAVYTGCRDGEIRKYANA